MSTRASYVEASEPNVISQVFSQDHCVHEIFEAQVELTPNSLAVISGEQQISYRELNKRANQVAHHLRRLGVGPEVLVALLFNRSVEMIVAIFGVLKAGGAYLPLDPSYPEDRLEFMLRDSNAALILTQKAVASRVPSSSPYAVFVDGCSPALAREDETNPEHTANADNLVYVIYTSGSTGVPKGVEVIHRALVNYTELLSADFDLEPGDRVLQFASFSFDTSAEEIFPCLASGASLVLRPEAMLDSLTTFTSYCESLKITILDLPTRYWHELAAEIAAGHVRLPHSVRLVYVGGEKMLFDRVAVWQNHVGHGIRLINGYGPTEATIVASMFEVPSGIRNTAENQIPIGRPIRNVQTHILDDELNPVPAGNPGELYIGGDGLARGYRNDPKLTAAKFILNPFSNQPGARLYKTGDLVSLLPDGNIQYFGRIDNQVKVRGFRVEPEETERVLAQHPRVRESAVVATQDHDSSRLFAFVVPTDNTLIPSDLRSFVRSRLPEYMVPVAFLILEAMPLTSNRKVDRSALASLTRSRIVSDTIYIGPGTETERALVEIWTEILGVSPIGVADNFFELGGDSLRATQIVARIGRVFKAEIGLHKLFEAKTISILAKVIESEATLNNCVRSVPIERVPRDHDLPLSFSQERVWFLQSLYPASLAYQFQEMFCFRGFLDVEVLQRTLSEIVRRHEIFRTTFPLVNDEPVQRIHPPFSVSLPVLDLRSLDATDRQARREAYVRGQVERPLNSNELPLVQWSLLRTASDEWALLHLEHHLLHDGWSFNVFRRELLEIYSAFSTGLPSPLPELSIQFADFACWQREWIKGEEAAVQLAYWKRKLNGIRSVLSVPSDRKRGVTPTFRGAVHRVNLPLRLCRELRQLSREQGVTLFMTMFAGFAAFLHRYSQQEDIAIGSGIANRRVPETENLLGMIVNNIVLRTQVCGGAAFRDFLEQVRDMTLEAYAHQDLPFDHVVRALQPDRDSSRNPLFQLMFSFHDAPVCDPMISGVTLTHVEPVSNSSAKFDMNIVVVPGGEHKLDSADSADKDEITILWEYNTDLYDASTVERMARHYETLLESIVTNPTQRISSLRILPEADQHQLLVDWNDTAKDFPKQSCIHEVFQEQVKRTPDCLAVVSADRQVTYADLNARANQLARFLGRFGVSPNEFVAICMEPSCELIVGLLAVLKAGGAYLPLDPECPKERISFMLSDARPILTLTQRSLAPFLPEECGTIIAVDSQREEISQEREDDLEIQMTSDQPAYVIYTSGSTGQPKGVVVPHRAVNRLVLNTDYLRFSRNDVVAQASNVSFDAATFEIWGALLNGARLAIVRKDVLIAPESLAAEIGKKGISVLFLTTALFNQLVLEIPDALATVNHLLFGGEAVRPSRVRQLIDHKAPNHLVHVYGPTEATTFASSYVIETVAEDADTIPIGRPISNTTIYLLDSQLQPVPIGVTGDIYIGGDGIALGYLNRPELTAEKFIRDPFRSDGARLYKTGDLARYRSDGNIEFVGRTDDQVKIRGFRVELGEIEAVLNQHPAVQEAVAVATRYDAGDDTKLSAYVVPNHNTIPPTAAALKTFLKAKLPDYMVPPIIIPLDKLPLTSNGKIDRSALPQPAAMVVVPEDSPKPVTETQKTVRKIWSDILGVHQVSMTDNFLISAVTR